MPKLCIVIPVHNEALLIAGVVRAVTVLGFEALVVDDGSSDASGEIARDAGASVIRNAHKSGKGATLRKGFDHALAQGYGAVVTMDGDGQHAAGDIAAFLECAKVNRPCLIVGNRMANHKGMPLVRYLTNRFMSALISLGCRQSVPDTQCGYRYIDAEILKQLPLTCDGFEIETEMLMKAAKKGFRICSVPIKTIYEDEESKIHPVRDAVRFFVYFIKELFSSD